jgi:acyl-coenzyme A thioesterase PaaI-like protein
MVRPGEWVEGAAFVTRATRTLAFARAELGAGGRKVLTAEGVFKLMKTRPDQAKK